MTAVWLPDPADVRASRIVRFATWLDTSGRASFPDVTDYRALQAWSVAEPGQFWASVAEFFEVEWSSPRSRCVGRAADARRGRFPGGTLNFGQHLLRAGDSAQDAVVLVGEDGSRSSLTYGELRVQAAAVAGHLRSLGVGPGDRVAAYLPNCVEGVVAFAACALIGAVWAQTGLDYAAHSAAERMAQLSPTVLIAGSGYRFGGRVHDRRDEVRSLVSLLPGLQHTSPCRPPAWPTPRHIPGLPRCSAVAFPVGVSVPFDHPLWVLFTSGTTGSKYTN